MRATLTFGYDTGRILRVSRGRPRLHFRQGVPTKHSTLASADAGRSLRS